MELLRVNTSYWSPLPGGLEDNFVLLFILIVDTVHVPVSIIFSALGCVCNPLAFAVFSRQAFRDTATSVYLRCLAIVDMGAILMGPLRYLLELAFSVDVRGHWLSCKAIKFLNGVFLYVSSWTLVAVTTERFVSVVWPHRVKQWSSKTSAGFVILVFVTFFALGSLPFLMFYEYVTIANNNNFSTISNASTPLRPSTGVCTLVYKSKLGNLLWWVFDAIFFAFLPSCLLVFFNVVIIKAIANSKKKVQKFSGESKQVGSTKANVARSQDDSFRTNSSNLQSKRERIRSRKVKERSLTYTLVVVSTVFVVCTFPLNAYGFGPHYQSEEGLGPLGVAISDLLILLVYTNNAFNFILYCLTGRKFRQETWALIMNVFSCGTSQSINKA